MKIVLMAIGGLVVAFGLVDFAGSFLHFDLWGRLGVRLPEILWRFSAYIELVIGFAVFKFGKSLNAGKSISESPSTEESASTT